MPIKVLEAMSKHFYTVLSAEREAKPIAEGNQPSEQSSVADTK